MLTPVVLGYRIFRFRGAGESLKFPVVLVRGLGRSSGFWLEFSEKLSEHADVICIDLLGTGYSQSIWGRGSIKQFANDVRATLDSLGVRQVFFVGISLGGMVALEVCAQSSLVHKVAVLASSSRGTGETRIQTKALFRLLWSLRKGVPSNSELAPFLVSSKTLQDRPQLPAVWDSIWKSEGFKKFPVLRQLLAAGLFDARPALARIKIPMLFMVSKADALVPWKNTLRLWERAHDAHLVVLENYGHDFPTEAPDEVIQNLLDFFRNEISKRT